MAGWGPIRIALVGHSRMLTEILEATLVTHGDFELVGNFRTLCELRKAVVEYGANFVIAGCDGVDEGQLARLLYEQPRVKILTLLNDGRTSFLYELRPHKVPLGEMAPERLGVVIRSAASGLAPEGAR